MHKTILIILFSISVLPSDAQKISDTIRIYFELNRPELTRQTTLLIDSLIYNDRIMPGDDIKIVGYADYLGKDAHNQTLSEARARNVEAYLMGYNIRKDNIKICIGKGAIEWKGKKDKEGNPVDRKVDIVIDKKIVRGQRHSKPLAGRRHTDVVVSGGKPHDSMDINSFKTGETFVLRNIYFIPQRHQMRKESLPALEKLYQVLQDNPNLKIKIEGHVCCIIDFPDAVDIDNGRSDLSVNRAKAVYDYLKEKGIEEDRLKYAGYGRSRPMVPIERNEEDADKNRRVEIRILEK